MPLKGENIGPPVCFPVHCAPPWENFRLDGNLLSLSVDSFSIELKIWYRDIVKFTKLQSLLTYSSERAHYVEVEETSYHYRCIVISWYRRWCNDTITFSASLLPPYIDVKTEKISLIYWVNCRQVSVKYVWYFMCLIYICPCWCLL